jgi:hypothetical protein
VFAAPLSQSACRRRLHGARLQASGGSGLGVIGGLGRVLEERSWRRAAGGERLEERSWRRAAGGEELEESGWRRAAGGERPVSTHPASTLGSWSHAAVCAPRSVHPRLPRGRPSPFPVRLCTRASRRPYTRLHACRVLPTRSRRAALRRSSRRRQKRRPVWSRGSRAGLGCLRVSAAAGACAGRPGAGLKACGGA